MIKSFLILCHLGFMAHSEWNEIYESGDIKQFLVAESKVHVSQRMKKACKLEQENQWFPENCLRIWNQSLMDVGNQGYKKNYKNLEKMCKNRAEEIMEMKHLQSLLDLLLPENCRKTLEERGRDLEYIEGRNSPEDI